RKLIITGLTLLSIGLILSAVTPSIAIPGYSREVLLEELSKQTSQQSFAVTIPDGSQIGWLGIGWLLVASIPATIGAGILAPSINSLITKQVPADQVGTTLGVSAAFVSGANAITPILGGAIFQFLGSTAPFLLGGILLLILLLPAVTRSPTERQPKTVWQHPTGSDMGYIASGLHHPWNPHCLRPHLLRPSLHTLHVFSQSISVLPWKNLGFMNRCSA